MTAPAIHCYTTGTGTSNSVTLTKPASGSTAGPDGAKNPAVGDYLLVVLANDDPNATTTWTQPGGWTQLETGDVGNGTSDAHCTAYIKKVAGTEGASFTFSHNRTTGMVGACILLSGVHDTQVEAIHKPTGTDVIDSTPPIAITGVTTTVDDCLAVAIWAYDGAHATNFTVSGTGWAELLEMRRGTTTSGESGGVAYRKMVGAGATGTCTVSPSTSDGMAGIQFALRPAPAPASVETWGYVEG